MSTDISMSIISSEGEYLKKDFIKYRNSEWFDNISENGNVIYRDFPLRYGKPKNCPSDFNPNEYYESYYVYVGDFMRWFGMRRPDIDAGWVCTYDEWLYEEKGIYPEDMQKYITEEEKFDMHFITALNEDEPSKKLYDMLYKNKYKDDDVIVYYFW